MAVSGVIAAFALIISFMVLIGRSMRRANSAWLIALSSSASARISPGEIVHSGRQLVETPLFMVIHDLLNNNPRDSRQIDRSVNGGRQGIVRGSEDQARRSPKIER